MNSYIVKSLREERGQLTLRPPMHRTGKRKSTFIDHNDYVVEDYLKQENELNNNSILQEQSSKMNSYILKSLREERGKLTPRPPMHRTGKRKSTFIDHNDYVVEDHLKQEKGPQLVKKK